MTTISVRLDKETQQDLRKVEQTWKTDRSEVIRRLLAQAIKEWKAENALELLSKHQISLSKAAEECSITLWEMLDLVKEKNIDWTDYSKEDLEKDLKELE